MSEAAVHDVKQMFLPQTEICCEYLVCKDVSLSDRSAVALILKEKNIFSISPGCLFCSLGSKVKVTHSRRCVKTTRNSEFYGSEMTM